MPKNPDELNDAANTVWRVLKDRLMSSFENSAEQTAKLLEASPDLRHNLKGYAAVQRQLNKFISRFVGSTLIQVLYRIPNPDNPVQMWIKLDYSTTNRNGGAFVPNCSVTFYHPDDGDDSDEEDDERRSQYRAARAFAVSTFGIWPDYDSDSEFDSDYDDTYERKQMANWAYHAIAQKRPNMVLAYVNMGDLEGTDVDLNANVHKVTEAVQSFVRFINPITPMRNVRVALDCHMYVSSTPHPEPVPTAQALFVGAGKKSKPRTTTTTTTTTTTSRLKCKKK